ncbi:putative zinc finger protein [Leucosporidium creatinivorum]|uniref:Putative zinc finger protein n=1 Tax=Leucosporidium creatinivorum TaxID=106004 RepID=A0A1Y2G4G9_9BASI|nr:putative zinc finger protein [Leucosporidium creatinivorum]
MARGLQKEESQKKAQAAAKAKAGGKSNLKTREAAFKVKCRKCMLPLSDYKNFTEHWNAKHPKDPMPTEEEAKM